MKTAIDKVKASKAKCKRHRDNWKARALAYDGIIRRAYNRLPNYPNVAKAILNSADFMQIGWPVKLPKHFGEMRFKAACRKTRRVK